MKYQTIDKKIVEKIQKEVKKEVDERYKSTLKNLKEIETVFKTLRDIKDSGNFDTITESHFLLYQKKLAEQAEFVDKLITDAKYDYETIDEVQELDEEKAFKVAKSVTPTKRETVTDTEAKSEISEKVFKDKIEVKKFKKYLDKLKDLAKQIERYISIIQNALSYKAHTIKRFELKTTIKRRNGVHKDGDKG